MKRHLIGLAFAAATMAGPAVAEELKTAVFAGGCFWCVEADFDKVSGVVETVSGYTGGTTENPTYEQVSAKGTGHAEAVRITYDADQVSYEELLDVFWRSVDPTDAGGQFCDRGDSYRTTVFALDEEQAKIAKTTRDTAQAELGKEIVTRVVQAETFWPAEDYHQDYYHKNPVRYNFYRRSCGRDSRLRALWGDNAYLPAKS
jgi:peptide-methionine (S)-S-oxide reductase